MSDTEDKKHRKSFGSNLTEEHKRKISEAGKGKKRTPEQRERYRQAALKRSAAHKEKLLAKLIERNKTGFNKGRVQSDEEKKAHSEAILKSIEACSAKPWENWSKAPDWADKISETKTRINAERRKKRDLSTPYGWQVESKVRFGKASAEKRGLDYKLTDDEAREMIISNCHYCDEPSDLTHPGGIDRVDNCFGYVSGNCVPACWPCNRAKSIMCEQEFLDLCTRVAKHTRRRKKEAKKPSSDT